MAKRKPKKSEFNLVHASVAEITELKKDIANLERMYEADQKSRNPKIQDVEEFRAEIDKKKKVLKDHAPKKFSGERSNKAYAEAKRLKKIIQDAMPTRKEHSLRYPKDGSSYDFERAVNREMAFMTNSKVQEAIRHYKHLLRRIDPSDLSIDSIEVLRKQ